MPLSSEDDIVTFGDGKICNDPFDDTIPDVPDVPSATGVSNVCVVPDVPAVWSIPPSALMEDDIPLSEEEQIALKHYDTLDIKRQKFREDLDVHQSIKHFNVSKCSIVKDMLHLYKDKSLLNRAIIPTMDGLPAIGDGGVREVFSTFWDTFLLGAREGPRQVCLPVGPNITLQDYESLGCILHHGFILTSYFPLRLSRASVHQALFHVVQKECMVDSFLQILLPRQRHTISQALDPTCTKEDFKVEELCDILEDYGNTSLPSLN